MKVVHCFYGFSEDNLCLAHRGVSALADKGAASRELVHFPYGKEETAHTPIAAETSMHIDATEESG